MRRKTTVGEVDADVLDYTAGKDRVLDLALAAADCMGTAAHVTMLARVPVKPPLLEARHARQIIAELREVYLDAAEGRFAITLEDQDVHLAVERRLTERLGEVG